MALLFDTWRRPQRAISIAIHDPNLNLLERFARRDDLHTLQAAQWKQIALLARDDEVCGADEHYGQHRNCQR